MTKIPELLSPAGSAEKLKSAIMYGANAVYLAGQSFGMRAAAANLTLEEIYDGVKFAHANNAKLYITVNTMPHYYEYEALEKYLAELNETGADALIIADLGVLSLAKKQAPRLEYHISTQAGAVSHADCNAWYELGASRVVLARELSLGEIGEIKKRCNPNLQLEIFVHGSMCVSWSGRCLLSSALVGRDPNRGMCAQPCRWSYKLFEQNVKCNGDCQDAHRNDGYTDVEANRKFEIEEEARKGQRYPIEEDELGTFIMSSKDLCMIDHIDDLCNIGVDSLKIEGRMKSSYYAAVTANAYSMALRDYGRDGKNWKPNPDYLRELESVSHRVYGTGYFYDDPMNNAQLVEDVSLGYIKDKAFLATVTAYNPDTKIAKFVQRNKMSAGDEVELVSPGIASRSLTAENITDSDGNSIPSTPHPYMEFSMPVPFEVKAGDMVRGK